MSDPTSLRTLLTSGDSVDFATLQVRGHLRIHYGRNAHHTQLLVPRVHAHLVAQHTELPPFPHNPNEPQYRGMRRRPPEEIAALDAVIIQRMAIVDDEDLRRERLDAWLAQAEGLASGRLRGRRGRGAVPPPGAKKRSIPQDAITTTAGRPKVLLHRILLGQHDVFTSPNIEDLSSEAILAFSEGASVIAQLAAS
jgi:hypothetical protein